MAVGMAASLLNGSETVLAAPDKTIVLVKFGANAVPTPCARSGHQKGYRGESNVCFPAIPLWEVFEITQ
jgi:hypothetical protein